MAGPTPHQLLKAIDRQVYEALRGELRRQLMRLELIAAENYVSEAVLAAQGSILTNKYAEGYPGARYYGGCEFVDVGERLAIERTKQLFWRSISPSWSRATASWPSTWPTAATSPTALERVSAARSTRSYPTG